MAINTMGGAAAAASPIASPDAPIVVSMGEPSGIGPEVAVAAFDALKGHIGNRPIRLIGDPDVFRRYGAVPDDALIATEARARCTPGAPSADTAPATIEAISTGVAMAMAGKAAALVTAPIHKAVLMATGFAYPGHTDFLAALTGCKRAVMMLAGPELRVVLQTVHIPVRAVPDAITREGLLETAGVLLTALQRDFAIKHPRLAVAALNPHAGEDGRLGTDERDVIGPATAEIRALWQSAGGEVLGPLPPDTMFHAEARARYDAALCMYHDQGLIPLKTLSFWNGVNVTLGLPIVRTSPDHGTGLDIAGRALADHRSMIAALTMASEIADARRR